jgi:hypothetical protein
VLELVRQLVRAKNQNPRLWGVFVKWRECVSDAHAGGELNGFHRFLQEYLLLANYVGRKQESIGQYS